jgi:hypothetical protein
MKLKRRERKTPKPAKVLYSVRVDGEVDALMKITLEILNRRFSDTTPGATRQGFTLTEMVNAILYDVFFDVRKHNTPRDYGELLGRMDDAVTTLPLTREMVDVFFDTTPAEIRELLEQQKRTPHS